MTVASMPPLPIRARTPASRRKPESLFIRAEVVGPAAITRSFAITGPQWYTAAPTGSNGIPWRIISRWASSRAVYTTPESVTRSPARSESTSSPSGVARSIQSTSTTRSRGGWPSTGR